MAEKMKMSEAERKRKQAEYHAMYYKRNKAKVLAYHKEYNARKKRGGKATKKTKAVAEE